MKWMPLLLVLLFGSDAYAGDLNLHDDAEHESESQSLRLGIGARIGGYGFRQVNEEGNLDWENCRMNGTGAFLTLEHGHLYTEVAADVYHTIAEPMQGGIDRLSLHTTAAIGARFRADKFISPHLYIGGGAEFTSVELFDVKVFAVAPVGFLGVGGELNFGDLRLGLTIRSNVMQLPVYDWDRRNQIRWETEASGQALFTARYVL